MSKIRIMTDKTENNRIVILFGIINVCTTLSWKGSSTIGLEREATGKAMSLTQHSIHSMSSHRVLKA